MIGEQLTIENYLARKPDFDGKTYVREFDQDRLTGQLRRVFEAMKDGRFRTLDEISAITGDPPASISARIRDTKKQKFGGHWVEKRLRGPRKLGLWEYRLVVNQSTTCPTPRSGG